MLTSGCSQELPGSKRQHLMHVDHVLLVNKCLLAYLFLDTSRTYAFPRSLPSVPMVWNFTKLLTASTPSWLKVSGTEVSRFQPTWKKSWLSLGRKDKFFFLFLANSFHLFVILHWRGAKGWSWKKFGSQVVPLVSFFSIWLLSAIRVVLWGNLSFWCVNNWMSSRAA